jgi:hypothetical protein
MTMIRHQILEKVFFSPVLEVTRKRKHVLAAKSILPAQARSL